MKKQKNNSSIKPDYVTALETVYGAPSQEAFGSAVFFERLPAESDLTDAALSYYKYFTGDKWDQWGETAWMSTWDEVYRRPKEAEKGIAAELEGAESLRVRMQADMLLNNVEDPQQAREALAGAFDAAGVSDLRAFTIGDGEAMSGILIAGLRKKSREKSSEATFLVFLMD